MNSAKAYCPASISLIFKIHPHKNPLKMGSTGVSFTVDKGVTATVTKAQKTTINFDGKEISFPTVSYVIRSLTEQPIRVILDSPLPLGCGFGLSGASALATGFALNKLLKLGKSKRELVKIAHIAEVKNKTGLGSVITQFLGGSVVRHTPGVCYTVTRLPFTKKIIYAVIFGEITTPSILTDNKQLEKINNEADKVMDIITQEISVLFKKLIDLSFSFAKKSGLLKNKQVVSTIISIRGQKGHATMTMLGEVVLSTIKPPNGQVIKLQIIKDTVRLL